MMDNFDFEDVEIRLDPEKQRLKISKRNFYGYYVFNYNTFVWIYQTPKGAVAMVSTLGKRLEQHRREEIVKKIFARDLSSLGDKIVEYIMELSDQEPALIESSGLPFPGPITRTEEDLVQQIADNAMKKTRLEELKRSGFFEEVDR